MKKRMTKFVKRNKGKIIVIGGVVMTVAAYNVYRKIYLRGYIRGGAVGSVITINWLDRTFPETKIKTLVETWMKENPGEVVSVKVR